MEAPAFYFEAFGNFTQLNAQATQKSIQKPQQSTSTQRSRQSSTSSQRSTSRSRSRSPFRAPLFEKNVAIGSIVFLPNDEKTGIHCVQPDCKKTIEDGAFEHPAVILKMWKSKDGELMTLACTMSSNPQPCRGDNARNLPIARQPREENVATYQSYLPEEVLYLEKAGTMAKQSYVQVKHVYTISLSKLAPFGPQFENRLSQQSYSNLMKVLNIEKAPWIPTAELESGVQDPSTMSTAPKAGLPTLTTRTNIITPMAALMKKTQKSISTSLNPMQNDTARTKTNQKGKKAKKFKAVAGHDFLSNMACAFT
ncbi:hypothetical protein BKA64DRAFT_714787 [Cadophora sp. MPI-SDFR-AT-0126]|nr:hypothetical protein BKA64DRAFT_714787 [Leotiomycetes sp. MPI-SDFR-AT-0126]